MFDKILIANRGEIACRIIRTAKKMGIRTVAVFSTADSLSLHVRLADEAYCIGEAKASESYLNINNIIEAAIKTNAKAIHPGYGFLSENVLFAKACLDAGIVFIGPDIKALEIMGSKQTARKMMADRDIPLTPGYHGLNQDDTHLLIEAKKIGFPVLLKAAAGGGGKGMRAVYQEADFIEQLHGARREARSSFADETMIIEKLVQKPRHVEVQIIADKHGQVLHLFERDCSIQRRHQKIIEEAPAPNISLDTRNKMHKAACQVAQSIDYLGAGTVEFLFDEYNNQFYFMEMNTRLQVEHPVTEMITGIDLVELQIIVAHGESLPITQDDISINGHAVECRVYAEDPANHFLPSIGTISSLRLPEIDGVRIDSGIEKFSSISRYYDPMIAKIIAHGDNRNNAISKLQMALEGYQLTGVKTNISFVHYVLSHEAFINSQLNTHFLEEHPYSLPEKPIDLLLCATIALSHNKELPQDFYGFALHEPQSWFLRLSIDEHEYPLFVSMPKLKHFIIHYHEKEINCAIQIQSKDVHTGRMYITINQLTQHVDFYQDTNQYHFFVNAQHYNVKPHQYIADEDLDLAPSGLTAPMPSSVVSVLKNKGDVVKKGDRLLILEAMKMEHSIHAPFDGLVEDIFFIAGQQVQEGAQLISILKDSLFETKSDEG